MPNVRLGTLLLAALAAQAVVAGRIHPGGATPDVVVLTVAAVAGGLGRRTGSAFGFTAGLAVDLYRTGPLGLTALAYTLVGHGLGGAAPGDRGWPTAGPGPAGAAWRGVLASAAALLVVGDFGHLFSAAATGAVLGPLVSRAVKPLLVPGRRWERALALRRAHALRPAGARTRW